MLSIRFSRTGKKKQPQYRVVVMEKTKDPWADYVEKLGHYNPRTKELVLNKERALYWIGQGAQPTNTVHNLFVSKDVIKEDKVTVTHLSDKRRVKMDDVKAKADDAKKAADETAKQAEEEAKAKAAEVKEEAPVEEKKEEVKVEVKKEVPVEEKKEEVKEEVKEETKEETKE
jgi:small subunit ribosomal protein S16